MTTPASSLAAGPTGMRDLHRTMLRIRVFEEQVSTLHAAGHIAGSVHLCIGQEAVPTGVMAVASPGDRVVATYRGHGWALACGVPAVQLFGEFMGRATGVNAGRGGSAYFSAPDFGFLGENSIVGAGAPIAAGVALAMKFDGRGQVAICSFGDGALNQGSVHEAFNFASAFDLPVVFVCENNRYSELTPIADMVRSDELYRRSSAYAFPGVRVDGNDPEQVAAAASTALGQARRGEGPTLIEAMTYRLVGHYSGDQGSYRPAAEVERARAEEPLVRSRASLLEAGAPEQELIDLEEGVRREIDKAAAEALAAPLSDASTAHDHVIE